MAHNVCMRIKHVVDNPYHLWAHQSYAEYGTDNYARNKSGNTSFNGADALSYSTVIAVRHEVKKSKAAELGVVFLLSDNNYSVTTSKHFSWIRHAIMGQGLMFRVPFLGRGRGITEAEHKGNADYMIDQIATALGKAKRARVNREWHEREALNMKEALELYVKVFKLSKKLLPKDATLEGITARKEEIRKAEAKEQREREAKARQEAQEDLAKWLNGETVYRSFYGFREAYMRLKPNSYGVPQYEDTVQTTRGAEVPMRHIAKVLPVVLRIVGSKTAWHRNGKTIRLGFYSLDSISASGDVTVGCHLFMKSEILRFAKVVQAWIEAYSEDATNPDYSADPEAHAVA